MFQKLPNQTSDSLQELSSSDIEQIRAALASSGPVATAVLYNNSKSLNRSLAITASAATADFSMSLMLMGG